MINSLSSSFRPLARICSWLLFSFLLVAQSRADTPLTTAEKSDYTATSRHAEVVEFCERLAKVSPLVRLGELGASVEGRKLPLIILADPPVATPQEAAKSKKLVVFAMGNIHAGEVDGKEALLMLARDIATAKDKPLLKDLIIVFAPIFNADGNEKISKEHRPKQNGPTEGVGVRVNAQEFDLNRDFVKLETPEVQALVRFFNKWDPAVFVDCHTTNGSYHRYTITYEGPRCPAGDGRLIGFVRDKMLPDVSRRLEQHGGFKSYFYGNFSPDRKRWETVPPTPRYGTLYFGLRNRIGILSESYSYAPFKDRVLASRAFVQSVFEYTAQNKDTIHKLLTEARGATVKAGKQPKETDQIVLRDKAAKLDFHQLLGFVEEVKDGKRVATDQPKEYEVEYWAGSEATLSVRRPYAYLLPATFNKVVETLQHHGIEVEELREDIELEVEIYRIGQISRGPTFQKHSPVTIQATPRKESRRVEAGSILVKTGQSSGSLAAYLLEPQAADGLTTWNFFDIDLREGQDFPVVRLPVAVPLNAGRVRPLSQDGKLNKPITIDAVLRSEHPPNFNGSPITGLTWLDDGEHYLQRKGGRLYKVHARTGKSQPFFDLAKLAKGLRSLPAISSAAAQSLAGSALRLNPQRTGALFEYASDLYFCNLDGTNPVRLTKRPGAKELASFSPDGKFVAFVRGNNLYVVDIATQTERALTTDGTSLVFNGKADWVYFEEIYLRSQQAYWWSPDSTRLVFLRIDDGPVHPFTVVDQISPLQVVETTRYPKAGDPNPLVKLGIVSVGGGPIQWVDLRDYSENSMLLMRAGWTPDSQKVYFYVADRAQTWMDVCLAPRDGGTPTRLFRETTKAWVDDPGAPKFLKDGSFLLASERSGWKHFYHFAKDGKLIRPVTAGLWEARTLHQVDEEGGWVYFSGTHDSPIAENLYRVKLDGRQLERLTKTPGNHQVSLSPKSNLFIDTWSDHKTPTQVRLYAADGALVRTLDTNPVYAREEYRLGKYELLQIPTSDGFTLEASLLKPANFDPQRRYPVWFMTYGGPHAPTIHDAWGGGRVMDEALAQAGFIVFRCDPRSASGKGACSTWVAYKKLGVHELEDIETAIRWLNSHSYIDASRIGMSGHSYGGFMTAFALTHSKLFAAGIAGAPVTDWRNYDTIYTERYMNTPQENPEGYNSTSVVKAAANLHGKLLLLHGLMDDNVHVQNTVQLVEELQKGDKDFEVMIYPRARHGGFGKHFQKLMVDFMKRTLRPEP
jgi:dipeptidyl aminopeptidase/acylaminoacyl peptidase